MVCPGQGVGDPDASNDARYRMRLDGPVGDEFARPDLGPMALCDPGTVNDDRRERAERAGYEKGHET
jgi:hypothetical protein